MIYVLFEVTIKEKYMKNYLELASSLKEHLLNQEGFIKSERFSSLINEGKILSLSIWKNEEALEKWRNNMNHRISQKQGREWMFENYTLTVTSKIRSYSNINREEAPMDSNQYFDNAE